MKKYISIVLFTFLLYHSCRRQEIAAINISIITRADLIEKFNACPTDYSSDSIILIKIQNNSNDTILIPLSTSFSGKWYSPESIAYFSTSKQGDTIYPGDLVTLSSFSVSFDTLSSKQVGYFCFPAYELTRESKQFAYAELGFSLFTLQEKEYKLRKLISLSPDREKLLMTHDTIPMGIKTYDRLKIGKKKRLIWSNSPPKTPR